VTGARYGPTNILVRAGLALGAAAGVLVAFAPSGDLASGPARDAPRTIATIDLEPAVGALGLAGALLLLAAASVPWLWAHLAGVALASIVAATSGLIVLTGRTSDDFAADADVSLERGGVLLMLAFWVGLAGVIVTLVGFRRLAMEAPGPTLATEEGAPEAIVEEEGRPARRTSGKATVALVLGIAGFITVFASTLAVAFGTLALGDIRASRGTLGGRGAAIAGLVLGFIALSLLIALVGSGMLSATPSD